MAQEDVDGSGSDNTRRGYRPPPSHEGRAALRTSVGPGKRCAPKNQPDDLSTLGIGYCHLDSNYLPIRPLDGPAEKIRPSHQVRKRKKEI